MGCSTKWREKKALHDVKHETWAKTPVTVELIDKAGIANLRAWLRRLCALPVRHCVRQVSARYLPFKIGLFPRFDRPLMAGCRQPENLSDRPLPLHCRHIV